MVAEALRNLEYVKEREERRYLHIGDKFWSLLLQSIGVNDLGNPKLITVVFNSQSETTKRITQEETELGIIKPGESSFSSYYSVEDSSIHVDAPFNQLSPDVRAEAVIHEMAHYVQDWAGKYLEMRKRGRNLAADTKSPWEVEAARIEKRLISDFLKYCYFDEATD